MSNLNEYKTTLNNQWKEFDKCFARITLAYDDANYASELALIAEKKVKRLKEYTDELKITKDNIPILEFSDIEIKQMEGIEND